MSRLLNRSFVRSLIDLILLHFCSRIGNHSTIVGDQSQVSFAKMSRGGGGGIAQLGDDLGDHWKDYGI